MWITNFIGEKMPNFNEIKSRLDGNELDISLMELTEVPVEELAAIPKATKIDMSLNKISRLPDALCDLQHITRIDMSRNLLKELPSNFGNLINLRHLDLYSNKLHMLPVSFYKLTKLRWLDLKDNPLDVQLTEITGDCTNEFQCQTCARNVVSFMKEVHSAIEKEREVRVHHKFHVTTRKNQVPLVEVPPDIASPGGDSTRDRYDEENLSVRNDYIKILVTLTLSAFIAVMSFSVVLYWYVDGDFSVHTLLTKIPVFKYDIPKLFNQSSTAPEGMWGMFLRYLKAPFIGIQYGCTEIWKFTYRLVRG